MSTNGRFTADGTPVARGEVVLLQDSVFAELARTQADGVFELAGEGGIIVGRALGEAIGVAASERGDGLDAAGPWHDLTLEIRMPGGFEHPPRLTAFLDPVELEALGNLDRDAALLQTGPASQRTHFATIEVPQPRRTVRVQRGRWRVGASFVIYERGEIATPDFHNFVSRGASAAGAELLGSEWSGFEVEVDGATTVTLHLRVLDDDEL